MFSECFHFSPKRLFRSPFSPREEPPVGPSAPLYYAKVDPLLDNLHGYPRYDTVLRKMKRVE
jgi:hypothetical protein